MFIYYKNLIWGCIINGMILMNKLLDLQLRVGGSASFFLRRGRRWMVDDQVGGGSFVL